METIARYLMFAGIALFLIGGGVYLAAKFGIPLGRLPGDIRIEGENGSFYCLSKTTASGSGRVKRFYRESN